ncbi:hypothetical protein CEXT_25641 [Caerostris extrusa]|uniref:Uncharacterized protein n=1 Tax=Caerostris extrusa TaxID=172846 RepID=A0AAV4Y7F7_CAEEX|nr:hypothetical protein CEXT_25641 [Caerostris extrusa]
MSFFLNEHQQLDAGRCVMGCCRRLWNWRSCTLRTTLPTTLTRSSCCRNPTGRSPRTTDSPRTRLSASQR